MFDGNYILFSIIQRHSTFFRIICHHLTMCLDAFKGALSRPGFLRFWVKNVLKFVLLARQEKEIE